MTDHAISELVTRKRLIESVATKCDGWWGRDSETGMQRVFRADEPIPDAAVPWWSLGGINGERALYTGSAPVPAGAPLSSVDARYRDLLNRLGCNGHDGAIAEISLLRRHLDEPADAALAEITRYTDSASGLGEIGEMVEAPTGEWVRYRDHAVALRARAVPELSAIRQAVARGWCHPLTSGTTMDINLAEAISAEIYAMLAAKAKGGE